MWNDLGHWRVIQKLIDQVNLPNMLFQTKLKWSVDSHIKMILVFHCVFCLCIHNIAHP